VIVGDRDLVAGEARGDRVDLGGLAPQDRERQPERAQAPTSTPVSDAK
jgi:hypothetical protein